MDSRVRPIGIFGTFDVENYGDLLFPLLAEFELTTRLGAVQVRPFSYYAKSKPDWHYRVSPLAELPNSVDRLDGALIGGGHIVRFDKDTAPGYYPPSRDLHHPAGYWLAPALMAQQAGVPTVWNAPGVHDDFPAWAEPLLTLAFGESPYVAVRDEPSRQALARFADKIALVPDTAFGVGRLLDGLHGGVEVGPALEGQFAAADGIPRWRESWGLRGPYVLVQATTGLEAFTRLVRNHPQVLGDHRLVIVPIGPVNGDREEHVTGLPNAIRLPSWPHPALLAALIGQAEAVVGSSLHLAITALACGVPVFRPAHCFEGKYAVLAAFDTVYRFDAAAEMDPLEFSARVGRGRPSAQVQACVDRLAEHWDRIADVITRGRRPVATEFFRFWQTLPNLLEAAGAPSRSVRAATTEDNASRRDILDLEKIERTTLRTVPFGWATIDGLFTRRAAQALAASFPRDHFKTVEGYDGEKGYRYEARSLIGMGATAVSHEKGLSRAWRQLAQDLLSPEYRRAMSRLIGIDLAAAVLEVNVFHYGAGAWLGPHVDLKDKIVTHVLYFNEFWAASDGGCLKILSSKDMNDEFAEITPVVGNSSVVVRSLSSWHAVSRVREGCRRSRRSVTVTFYHPGSISTMWPPGDQTPLHSYRGIEGRSGFWRWLSVRLPKRDVAEPGAIDVHSDDDPPPSVDRTTHPMASGADEGRHTLSEASVTLERDERSRCSDLNAPARIPTRGVHTPAAGARPQISVVVPAYNHAAYIDRALESVVAQRLPAGLGMELIVVDDGSTDDTGETVRGFMARHPDVDMAYIRQQNAGAPAAINRGVESSRGIYVSLLNSDDEYAPGRIEAAYGALLQSGQSLCFTDFDVIDDLSREIGPEHVYVRFLRDNVAKIASYPSLGYSLLRFHALISTGNMFFTRRLFDQIGGFADLPQCHDWDFSLSALEYTAPVRIEQRLYRYRLHGRNTFLRGDGDQQGVKDIQTLLAKAASRMLAERRPGTYPSLNAPTEYLVDLLRQVGAPVPDAYAPDRQNDSEGPRFGTGWHAPEYDGGRCFRWTGPEKGSWLELPWRERGDGLLRVDVLHAMTPRILEELRICVNSQVVPWVAYHRAGVVEIEARVPAELLDQEKGCARVAFHVHEVVQPRNLGTNWDSRPLGVAIADVTLVPTRRHRWSRRQTPEG